MKIIHVLSTSPWRAALGEAAPYRKDSVELMVWLLAILEGRRFGQAHLYTDQEGQRWARECRLDRLYQSIAYIPVLPSVDYRIFWDIGKVLALEMTGADSLIADLDLVFFKRPWNPWNWNPPVVIGHEEPVAWDCYQSNRDIFGPYGFGYAWDWSAAPVNTCLLAIADYRLRGEYVRWSLNTAQNFTRHPSCFPGASHHGALFASQQLLGMLLGRWGVSPMAYFKLRLVHHQPTDRGFHLWGRKDVYRQWLEPRVMMLNWLREKICARGEDGIEILRLNNLWREFGERGEIETIKRNGRAPMTAESPDNHLTRTVLTLNGQFHATDPCTGIERRLATDRLDKIYRGDVVTGEGSANVSYNGRHLAGLHSTQMVEFGGETEIKIWATQI